MTSRLEGLDMARFAALVGMVIVNFNMVMTGGQSDAVGFNLPLLLQGRAAATFVILAGLGLGLASSKNGFKKNLGVTLKRAIFLLVLGLLNMLIFDADIIHYYAFYFFFAVFFLRAPVWVLWITIFTLIAGFVGLVLGLEYDTGWNWETYSYGGFWTPSGFFRNLFYNGWHPVIPWFAFILFGIWLSRLNLRSCRIQIALTGMGLAVLLLVTWVSKVLMSASSGIDPELPLLFSTSPVPPFPLYMIAGASFASAMIGVCLLLESRVRAMGLLPYLTRPGRQTLTLYIAHIVLGMGVMQALGFIGGQPPYKALIASAIFCALAVIYAWVWAKAFKRGPLEMLMRRLT